MFGISFLTSGRVTIPPEQCTQADFYGCDRQGTTDNIINPIRSTRVDTRQSFGFRYGELEIRAKMPRGDWLWPALWLMPKHSVYGGWPRSGEIDLMEMRGNANLLSGAVNVGVQQVGHTMHFGPQWDVNGWPTTHSTRNQVPGFDENFHRYRMRWTDTGITFFVDDVQTGNVAAGTGFWDRGGFAASGLENPWAGQHVMAPFDQEFYIIMNLAVGGTNYFSDSFVNSPNPKPWHNTSPRAAADFWDHRHWWMPTWNLGTEQPNMQIDYVRVWAV
jgi:beta-glucanase (GH16 family)